MDVRPPTREFLSPVDDSRRWRHVELRPDDIVISTPPKCGTTWTQGIVRSLLWPSGDAPGTGWELSPWPDFRLHPADEMRDRLAGQRHRRFIKTHSPRDAVPIGDMVAYVLVYRHPADALVSWANHRRAMRPEITSMLNDLAAADGIDPIDTEIRGEASEVVDEWESFCSPAVHLASWWEHRHDPAVLMLHYSDVFADLDGAMRRVAEFLHIDVDESSWPDQVERCRIGSMREAARGTGIELGFDGGPDAFFHRGGDGRGVETLDDEMLLRIDSHCAEHLSRDADAWLRSGGPLP